MKTKHIILSLSLLTLSISFASGQNSNMLYFMEELGERTDMNPALTPECKGYFDFIVLPNLYLGVGNNALTLHDLVFNQNGKTTSILSPGYDMSNFMRTFPLTTRVNTNFKLNIFNVGWSTQRKNYYTIGLRLRGNVNLFLPRDMFKLVIEGTPNENGVNNYNLRTLGVDATVYSELSAGYARKINDKWQVGGTVKFLMGYANVNSQINQLGLETSRMNWTLSTQGRINASIPVKFGLNENGQLNLNDIQALGVGQYYSLIYNPAGYGAAIDLGFTYKPIKGLTISGAITDLGFINWSKHTLSGSMSGSHIYDGAFDVELGEDNTEEAANILQQLGEDIVNSIDFKEGKSYNRMLMATFYAGIEYGILNNKISFSALSKTQFNPEHIFEEVTVQANFRPAKWFKASVGYTFLEGGWGTMGLGLNATFGALNMYIMTDFLPVNWTMYNANGSNFPLPYRTQYCNLQMGWGYNIGRFVNDRDNDGVKNRKDKCPDTDMDFLRKTYPNAKIKEYITSEGCLKDEDGDGIPDFIDASPNTPLGVVVDSQGCPIDSDADGVPDYLDRCPDTPAGIEVDNYGCPIDSDGDGVPDYRDKCPKTPAEAYGRVDEYGCPKDSDGDGVPDYIDQCPNTPLNTEVDKYGCPKVPEQEEVTEPTEQIEQDLEK